MSHRFISYKAGVLAEIPSVSFLFLPEKVFLCRFWGEPPDAGLPAGFSLLSLLGEDAGTCLPLCGEAAFCLWLLSKFSPYVRFFCSLNMISQCVLSFVDAFVLPRVL